VPYVNGIVDNSDSVQEEPSVEATVSATETSNVDGPEDNNDSDEEDEEEEEEKTSSAKKLWRFLIT
jgi:hypothetical protein